MPEGDTIHRTATTLRRILRGQRIRACRSTVPRVDAERVSGRVVGEVVSRGKNLLIHLEEDVGDELVIYTHMKMTGSWHVYRPGERWQKPSAGARLVLETARAIAVCFHAPVVELFPAAELPRHPVLSRLGPDPLAPEFDPAEARSRIQSRRDLPIGEALLDQTAIAGIGNVYKSEVLFLCGENPFAPVRDIGEERLDRVIATVRRLMSRNLGGYPRVTRSERRGERHWVYDRSGRPCARCGTRVRMRRQGETGRSTYWCPQCQVHVDRPAEFTGD